MAPENASYSASEFSEVFKEAWDPSHLRLKDLSKSFWHRVQLCRGGQPCSEPVCGQPHRSPCIRPLQRRSAHSSARPEEMPLWIEHGSRDFVAEGDHRRKGRLPAGRASHDRFPRCREAEIEHRSQRHRQSAMTDGFDLPRFPAPPQHSRLAKSAFRRCCNFHRRNDRTIPSKPYSQACRDIGGTLP